MTPPRLIQLLLLFGADAVRDLSPALWAAFLETEKFYNFGERRAEFERYYLSPHTPPGDIPSAAIPPLPTLGRKQKSNPLHLLHPDAQDTMPGDWETAFRGRYSKTLQASKLRDAAREFLSVDRHTFVLIVTDREITPPAGWRYTISDEDGGSNAVVSAAPTDPVFWRQHDPSRVATIKHRIRAACLGIAGEYIGFESCDNPTCFLFKDVDSATTLDSMLEFGPEHSVTELTGRGFDPQPAYPSRVQQLKKKVGMA